MAFSEKLNFTCTETDIMTDQMIVQLVLYGYAVFCSNSNLCTITAIDLINFTWYILFVTLNHQATNLVFPKLFNDFFSVLVAEKENNLFIGPKNVFPQFPVGQ